MKNMYMQLDDIETWRATTDRNFKEGDRVVSLHGGYCDHGSCPTRGLLLEENPYWPGCFAFLADGKTKEHSIYTEMSDIVKESEFDAKRLQADN